MKKEIIINEFTNIHMIVLNEEDVEYIKSCIPLLRKGCEETNNEFIKRFNIPPKKVMSYGDTSQVSSKLLSTIIPNNKRYPNLPRSVNGSYHCYVCKEPTIIIHEDIYSSWNCLMQANNNPKNVLIYSK